ncbi:phage tail tape measure protein [Arcanobacterium canis]
MSTQVGSANVAIFPTMQGFKQKVSQEFSGAASSGKNAFQKGMSGAGAQIGQKLGSEISSAFGKTKFDTSGIDAYKRAVTDAGKAVSAARLASQDANAKVAASEAALEKARATAQASAVKVEQAEKKLAEAIQNSGKDSLEARDAEAKLEQARANAQAAAARVESAEVAVSKAKTKAVEASDKLKVAEEQLKVAHEAQAAAAEHSAGHAVSAFSKIKDAAAGVGEKIKGSLTGAFNFFKENAIIAIGAVAGAAKGLYSIGAAFDDMGDTIRIGTGATGKSLEELKGAAENVATTVPITFQEAGQAVADWNTRMGLTGKAVEKVAAQTAALKNMGLDVDINQTAAAFKAFGINGDGVAKSMDTLFRVSQATGVSMNDLASGVQKSAPAFQSLGFSFDDAAAMMGNFDKAGLNAEQMAGAMTKSLTALAKQGREPKAAFREVTSEIANYVKKGDEAGALNAAGKIFGTRGAAQFVKAVKDGSLSLDGMIGKIGATSDTILGTSKETEDFAEKWTILKNKVQEALKPLSSAVFDGLSAAIEKVGSLFDGLVSEGFGGMQSALSGVLPVAGAAAGIFGGMFGSFASGIPIIGELFGGLAGLTGPIGLVIGAVAGMIANSQALCDAFGQAFSVIGQLATQIGATLAPLLPTIGQALGQVGDALAPVITTVATLVQQILPVLLPIIQQIIEVLSGFIPVIAQVVEAAGQFVAFLTAQLGPVIQGLLPIVSQVFESIGAVITAALGVVKGIIQTVMSVIKGDWSGAWDGIKTIFSSAWDLMKAAVQAVLTVISAAIRAGWELVKGIFSTAWEAIKAIFVGVWNGLKAVVTGGISAVVSFIGGLPGKAVNALSALGSKISSVASSAWKAFKNAVSTGISSVVSLVGSLPSKIISALGNVGSMLYDSGASILRGLWTGISSMVGWVGDKIGGAMSYIRSWFPFSPAKRGPFSGRGWVSYSGRSIAQAMGQGILDATPDTTAAAHRLAAATKAALNTTVSPRISTRDIAGIQQSTLAQKPAPAPQAGVVFHIGQINNPVREPSSTSLARELQRTAAGAALLG